MRICLIPAAGFGLRARPLTRALPKAMLMVGDKPVLQHTIEMIRDQLGITSFIVITGYLSEVVENYFGGGEAMGVNITYVLNTNVEKGLAWSIYLGKDYIDNNFLVVLGDEYYLNSNHYDLQNYHMDGVLAVCGVVAASNEKVIRQNYTLDYTGNKINSLVEKPENIVENTMGTGTFVLSPGIFRFIERRYQSPGDRITSHIDFVSLLDTLCQQGYTLEAFQLSCEYVNINDLEALDRANIVCGRTIG